MKICKERLLACLLEIGKIGRTPDGICREAFTSNYYKSVKALKMLMESEGLKVRIDAVGNVYGRKPGGNSMVAPVLVGSHLDTVRNGGLYDGMLGIAAALECVAMLNEKGIQPENDIEIVAFNGEEGGLLGGTFGSRVAAGNQTLNLENIDEKLAIYELEKEDIRAAKLGYIPKCYLELHIEQGIQLYREKIQIGIVDGIVGITRYKITVYGEANHAGTTPMSCRKDALVGASRLILIANQMAHQEKSPFVATVGKITIAPNSVNVVPGCAELILELREMEKELINHFVDKLKMEAKKMSDYHITFDLYSDKNSVYLDQELTAQIEEKCREGAMSCKHMYSGAGHDAMEMARITRAAMIFIPSKNGISHSKDENSSDEDIVRGAELLLDVILQVSGGSN